MTTDVIERTHQADPAPAAPLPRARELPLLRRRPGLLKALFSMIDQTVVSGTSFATAVIIGRACSANELGLYYLTLSVFVIGLGILEQVVSAPYTIYSKRRTGQELAEYSGSVWAHQLALIAVGVLSLLVATLCLFLMGSVDIVRGLGVLAAAAPLLLVREGIRRFSFANLHLTTVIVVDSVVAVFQLSGLVLLAYLDRLSIVSIYGVMGAACALACLGWYAFTPPKARFVRSRFLPDWIHNWSFAKWALRSFLAGNTTPYIIPWIVTLALGTAATGMLGACATLVGVTSLFLSSVCNVLTPQTAQAFVSGGVQELSRILALTATVFAVALGGFCLAIFLTGDRLAVMLYGDPFQGTGAILTALALAKLMDGFGIVAGNGLWAMEQPRANFAADVCNLLVTLLLAVLLVAPLGVLGAALAIFVGTMIATIVRVVTLLRAFGSCASAQRAAIRPQGSES